MSPRDVDDLCDKILQAIQDKMPNASFCAQHHLFEYKLTAIIDKLDGWATFWRKVFAGVLIASILAAGGWFLSVQAHMRTANAQAAPTTQEQPRK
jgi:hypothetical protein